jgi:hypothetical protein
MSSVIVIGLLGSLLMKVKKRKRSQEEIEAAIMEAFYTEDTIPVDLIKSRFNTFKQFQKFVKASNEYTVRSNEVAASLVANLEPGLKHQSLHCISNVASFESLCGFSMPELGNLMATLRRPLAEAFPRCPETLAAGDHHAFCSRIMKLFLILFRCRLGSTFVKMEAIFGWSYSVLEDDFKKIILLIATKMRMFNADILTYLGQDWQKEMLRLWQVKHICFEHDDDDYKERIRLMNEAARKKSRPPVIDLELFRGSLGAIDGTYSLVPRISEAVLLKNNEDTSKDRMYSEYIKDHAYKLMPLVSHGFNGEKYILGVGIGPASISDNALGMETTRVLKSTMIPSAALSGDHAFHGVPDIIVPYTKVQLMTNAAPRMTAFNKSHSSDRMCSEHGNRMLKTWGIIRGRSDCRLVESDELFRLTVLAVTSLINYKTSGCPVLDL